MTINYHKGIDVFYSDVDKPPVKDPKCSACESTMRTERYATPRGFAEAMAKRKTDSYVYSCSHSGKPAHDHLVDLYREWEDLKSDRLKAIVMEEILEKRKKLTES
jgi:hypothetical protein